MSNNIWPAGLETTLILDQNRASASHSAGVLASRSRLILTGCDAALGGLIVRRMPLTSLVTEAQIAGPFSFDGLDVVDDVRRRAPDCRIVVTGRDLPPSVSTEAVRRGAAGVFLRPFDDASFRQILGLDGPNDEGVILHIPTIEEFIRSEHLLPAFQPIVDLTDCRRETAFESLARYRQNDLPFCDPCFMFEYARLCGKTIELDLECLRRTFHAARFLAREGKIFVNVHPRAIADGDRFARTLTAASSDSGVPLDRVVVEITEQEKIEASASTVAALDELRLAGIEFALDDVGVSYSHLDLIDRIRPSYLKISQELGTDFEKDASRRKIVRNILALASDFGCETILEGVETEATSVAAKEIGARYAQGYLYARPRYHEPRCADTSR